MKLEELTEASNEKTSKDIDALQKKARKSVKEIFNKSFPIPVRSVARGGEGMRSLVFTFTPEDVKQLNGMSKKWTSLAKKVENALAKHGLKGELKEVIWKNNGEMRVKPKVLLTVDLITKLEDLFFDVQHKQYFDKNKKLPRGITALIKQVNELQ